MPRRFLFFRKEKEPKETGGFAPVAAHLWGGRLKLLFPPDIWAAGNAVGRLGAAAKRITIQISFKNAFCYSGFDAPKGQKSRQ